MRKDDVIEVGVLGFVFFLSWGFLFRHLLAGLVETWGLRGELFALAQVPSMGLS